MCTIRRGRLVFLLALLAYQGLFVAHLGAHPGLSVGVSCQICLHVPGSDGSALPASAPVPLPQPTAEAPPPPPAQPSPLLAADPARIRGPPLRLA
jgi:hypothetical protein